MELRRGLAEDLYLCLEVWLGLGPTLSGALRSGDVLCALGSLSQEEECKVGLWFGVQLMAGRTQERVYLGAPSKAGVLQIAARSHWCHGLCLPSLRAKKRGGGLSCV